MSEKDGGAAFPKPIAVGPAGDVYYTELPGMCREAARAEGEKLIEEGVGLIAQGMYRIGDSDLGADPETATAAGLRAVSVIRGTALDFLRKVRP